MCVRPEIPRTEVRMFRAEDWTHMLTAKVALPPGLYQIKFCPLTVLPPPKKDAPLLMSDIDGTLLAHGTPEGEV